MVAGFIAIGLGLLAVAADAWAQAKASPRRALLPALYGCAGVGMIVAGLVPTEPGLASTSEIVHSRASAAATVLIVSAALATAWWPGTAASRRQRILACVLTALAAASVAFHETTVSGASQRMLWAAIIVWLVTQVTASCRQPERDPQKRGSVSV